MSEIIRVEHLNYVYNPGMPDETTALDDVSFSVDEGDFVGIIGSTGSGKSTLISHFNGLNRPTSGRILIDGKDMWEQGADLRAFRFQVGLVMQYPEYQLFEETCAKDIAYGLDPEGRDTILSQIRDYHEKTGITVLLVSHSMEDIAKYANRVLVMSHAKLAMYDTVENVFAHAQELLELGLSVPQVTQIFLKLRQMGLDIPTDVYTMPYAVKTIQKALAAKQAKGVQ